MRADVTRDDCMDSLTFLEKPGKAKVRPVWAVHGDEAFLQRRVVAALRALVLGPDDDGFNLSTHSGDKATWAAVIDDLQTLPLLGPRRLVVVEGADPFVTRERPRLERYVTEHPPGSVPPPGVLVLQLHTMPSSTRLAKLLGDVGAIACKPPRADALAPWCMEWSASRHGKELAPPAARLLVDLVGADMGLLDQELAKLAVYAGDAARIETADVDKLVGSSRSENTWKIFDLIGTGQAALALELLNRLLDQGEEPLRLLGAFSLQLRRLAQAGRLHAQGVSLGESLEQAGVPPFARRQAEQQMRHLGRRRLDSLYDWLLQADAGIKGASPLPPRTLMERLVVQLARGRQP
jgi:DNA polymerase-3 subunit delta